MASSKTNPYRSIFQVALAALLKESGFTDADPNAISSLTEMAQSFMSQIARSSKHYSELANRSQVTENSCFISNINKSATIIFAHWLHLVMCYLLWAEVIIFTWLKSIFRT